MRLSLAALRPKRTPAWSQIVLLLAMALRMVCSLALTIIVGRSISPAAFGTFALVATVFTLSHEFTDMGTGNVAVRSAARAPGSERTVLEQLLGLRLLLSLAAAIVCTAFALTQTDPMARGMLLATAGILALSCVSACGMVFQLRQAQVPPAMLSVLVQAGTVVTAAIMVLASVGDGWFPGTIIAREAVAEAGTLLLAAAMLGYTPRPRFSGPQLRSFFGSAAVVALATLTYHIQLHGGMFWIQMLRPEAELGAFAAAQRPLAPVLFVPWIIMLPLVPVLSWLASADRPAFRRQSQAAIDLSIGLGAVMAVVTFCVADSLMAFLYGTRFSEGGLSAIGALRWLAPAVGCSFAVAAVSTVLVADHREWALLRLSLVGLALYSALNAWLIPGMGFQASAIASAASLAVLSLGGLALTMSLSILPGIRTATILAPAAVLYPLLTMLPGQPFARLAAATPLTALALAAVWFFPGIAADRTEQALLTRDAMAAHE